MSWSQAEVVALAGRAARGAGAPPEQAARFGQAAAFHLARGGEAAVLLQALEALPEGPIINLPRLLDATLARAAQGACADFTLCADMSAGLVQSYLGVFAYATSFTVEADGLMRVTVDFCALRIVNRAGRIDGGESVMTHFAELAMRTFVPETEASRLTGAGGASDDND